MCVCVFTILRKPNKLIKTTQIHTSLFSISPGRVDDPTLAEENAGETHAHFVYCSKLV